MFSVKHLRQFITFLNIKPSEERLIGWLALLYFLLSLSFVLVQAMAFGLFLTEYGIGALPYSYIIIAIIASSVVAFYIKLDAWLSFSKLLVLNLSFLVVVTLLIWLALRSPFHHAVAFILPLWFQVSINLGSLAVWSLAGRLFDFRQGKRLFPLLSASSWLAEIIAGLFILALVNFIGTVHLLFLAGLCFGLALLIMRFITYALMPTPMEKPQVPSRSRPVKTSSGILGNRYVLLIFLYILIWWVAFFIMDNIFYDRAYAQYPQAQQLTAFIGRLVTMTGIVALFSSLVISSRVITRFGLRAALVAMPLAVTLCVGALAVSGSLDASLFFIFLIATIAKLINVAFGFSLSQAAHAIVYQSLPDTLRGRVQTAAEGIVQPMAVGLAGISLLVLTAGLKFSYVGLTYVFLGLGVAWLAIIWVLSSNYVHALTQVITRRRLGDDANVLPNPISVELLKKRLHDPHPGAAIYALTKLETLDEQAIRSELAGLIRHPAPEVRREAFRRIEKWRLDTACSAVQSQYAVETVPFVKEAALRALGAISQEKGPILQVLNESDVHSLRGALIALLKYSDDSLAEPKIHSLLASSSVTSRNLAIEIIAEAKQKEFYPQLISACDRPETSHAAGQALVSLGADALPLIQVAFCAPDAPRRRLSTLVRALGKIGGTQAQTILLSRIATPDSELRLEIFTALSQSGYHTNEIATTRQAMQTEITQAAWVSAVLGDLSRINETELLAAALQHFHKHIRQRLLLLLSFVFDRSSILRVQEALMTGSQAQIPYALEVMDAQLPTEWKKEIMPLLEELSPQERNEPPSTLFPQTKEDFTEQLRQIITNDNIPYWLRACAVYTSARLGVVIQEGDYSMLSTVEKVLVLKSVSIFSQTPDNVLADVANLLEEVDVSENETIFKQGDSGDSLYVILDGRVRVHDNGQLLNYLGEHDVFGEMALLDPEPRLASVVAVEPTRLFRLDQSSFYQLMAERPEVATGIIRVLTRHLRNRVHDISELKARIQELENRSTR